MNPANYSKFEDSFRGSREDIIARLSGYEGLLEQWPHAQESQALDLGCGRGEWLQLLDKHGYQAKGIDINPVFVQQCRTLGLNAVCIDVFSYLEQLSDQSCSLVSAFHLIEHLTSNQVFVLLKQLARILRPDGLLILETPSIDNILVATKSFYIDPTHVNPIHPEFLTFTIQSLGLCWAESIYLNGGVEQSSSPERLVRVLNGVAQDVCILASQTDPRLYGLKAPEWRSKLHRAPTTLEALYQYQHTQDILLENFNLQLAEQRRQQEGLNLQLEGLNLQLEGLNLQLEGLNLQLDEQRRQFESLYSSLSWVWYLQAIARIVPRTYRKLKTVFRKPAILLTWLLHRSGLTNQKNRKTVSKVLSIFGLYYPLLAVYEMLYHRTDSRYGFAPSPPVRFYLDRRKGEIVSDLKSKRYHQRNDKQ